MSCKSPSGGDNLCHIYRAYAAVAPTGHPYLGEFCGGCDMWDGDTTPQIAQMELNKKLHAGAEDPNYFDILRTVRQEAAGETPGHFPELEPYPDGIDPVNLFEIWAATKTTECKRCQTTGGLVRDPAHDKNGLIGGYLAFRCSICGAIIFGKWDIQVGNGA